MIEALALATTVLALLAGLVVLVAAAVGRYRWPLVRPSLFALQVAAVIQAVAVAVRWVGGHAPGEPATHIAYLLCTLVVLPVIAVQVVADDGRWAGVLVGVGLLVLAVLTVRAQATYRPAHG